MEYPPMFYFIFAGLAAYFVASDIWHLRRGGVAGAKRIVRHLGRMCFGFFFAVSSFFLGQIKHLPDFIVENNVHYFIVLGVVALWVFWFIRVRFTKWYEAA